MESKRQKAIAQALQLKSDESAIVIIKKNKSINELTYNIKTTKNYIEMLTLSLLGHFNQYYTGNTDDQLLYLKELFSQLIEMYKEKYCEIRTDTSKH